MLFPKRSKRFSFSPSMNHPPSDAIYAFEILKSRSVSSWTTSSRIPCLFALFTCVGRINRSIRTQITSHCSTIFLSEEFSSTKSHSFEIFCCKTSSCTKLVPSQELHQHESHCQSLPCTSKKCLMHFNKILIWVSHAMFIICATSTQKWILRRRHRDQNTEKDSESRTMQDINSHIHTEVGWFVSSMIHNQGQSKASLQHALVEKQTYFSNTYKTKPFSDFICYTAKFLFLQVCADIQIDVWELNQKDVWQIAIVLLQEYKPLSSRQISTRLQRTETPWKPFWM